MEDCCVCYNEIKNKVILNCTHELCVKCLLILQDEFKCPMCRVKYNFYETEVVETEIDSMVKKVPSDTLLTPCLSYEISLRDDKKYDLHVLTTIDEDIVDILVYRLCQQLPQRLKEATSTYMNYKLIASDHYMQDYYSNVIIKKITTL